VLPDWVNSELLRARMSDNGTLTVEVPLPQVQPAQPERLINIQQMWSQQQQLGLPYWLVVLFWPNKDIRSLCVSTYGEAESSAFGCGLELHLNHVEHTQLVVGGSPGLEIHG
jgi:hypothetical protein